MENKHFKVLHGNCLDTLKTLEENSIDCCVTSPPYYGLRDYDGGEHEIGNEETPEEFIENLVNVFSEVKRVLKPEGTLWINIGDSYANTNKGHNSNGLGKLNGKNIKNNENFKQNNYTKLPKGYKQKDLIGIPWMLAFALRNDGWYLRQDIIWCLSGGTMVYARTQKGDMPMTLKDIYRLNPSTVKLWNGKKWTQLLGMSKTKRKGDEIEIVLRSGERISCTPNHIFPTTTGLSEAGNLKIGDKLIRTILQEPELPNDCAIDLDAAWLAGLYIAEGSMSGNTIQIAGHKKEKDRWERLQRIATKFGGHITRTISGNKMDIRLYGKILVALINELVSGKTAIDKGFNPAVWKFSNAFLNEMLDGYLKGDGHFDEKNNRWRLGFCRNYNLERDLRTCCARLGIKLVLTMATVKYNGENRPIFKGEIRFSQSNHFNIKDVNEIMELRKARCRYVYDLGVEDEPHLFSLSSGILTHNCKPNPMPESVKDRCTKSHEYIFLLSKSKNYYFDYEAIQEPATGYDGRKDTKMKGSIKYSDSNHMQDSSPNTMASNGHERWKFKNLEYDGQQPNSFHVKRIYGEEYLSPVRNKRSVWNVATQPYAGKHYAVYPPKLIEPCVLAGCPKGGIVLDPFGGSGTTAGVAIKHGRKAILCELNNNYIDDMYDRINGIIDGHIQDETKETPLDKFFI